MNGLKAVQPVDPIAFRTCFDCATVATRAPPIFVIAARLWLKLCLRRFELAIPDKHTQGHDVIECA
jgi:hypothetical protein